jgi:hypothetical protein
MHILMNDYFSKTSLKKLGTYFKIALCLPIIRKLGHLSLTFNLQWFKTALRKLYYFAFLQCVISILVIIFKWSQQIGHPIY